MYRFEIWLHKTIPKDTLEGLKEFLKNEFGTTVEDREIKA
jgi:hypothetical protein